VEAHYNLGIALRQKGKIDESIAQYEKAIQLNPEYGDAHINLGTALLEKGRVDDAISHLQKALQVNPGNAHAQNDLGNALLSKGNVTEAITHFQQAMRLEPDDPWVKNNLAWILATSSKASCRDGNTAVQLASQANDLAGGDNPIILHTLAAAYAETGQFADAVQTAQRALQLAEAQSKVKLAGKLQSELILYQVGSPFHNP
jgi:tetratricopeptide (TPR) repeat protein